MSTQERRLAQASRQKQAADDEIRRMELAILRMELELECNIDEREHRQQLAKISSFPWQFRQGCPSHFKVLEMAVATLRKRILKNRLLVLWEEEEAMVTQQELSLSVSLSLSD